jgi:hypothetical protein
VPPLDDLEQEVEVRAQRGPRSLEGSTAQASPSGTTCSRLLVTTFHELRAARRSTARPSSARPRRCHRRGRVGRGRLRVVASSFGAGTVEPAHVRCGSRGAPPRRTPPSARVARLLRGRVKPGRAREVGAWKAYFAAREAPRLMGRRARSRPHTEALVERVLADERWCGFPSATTARRVPCRSSGLIASLRPGGGARRGTGRRDRAHPVARPIRRPGRRSRCCPPGSTTKNELGRNGVLSPAEDVPARYRGWWPFPDSAPSWPALRAGGRGRRTARVRRRAAAARAAYAGGGRETVAADGRCGRVRVLRRARARSGFPVVRRVLGRDVRGGRRPGVRARRSAGRCCCSRRVPARSPTPDSVEADGSVPSASGTCGGTSTPSSPRSRDRWSSSPAPGTRSRSRSRKNAGPRVATTNTPARWRAPHSHPRARPPRRRPVPRLGRPRRPRPPAPATRARWRRPPPTTLVEIVHRARTEG